jgi:hypothetical protein
MAANIVTPCASQLQVFFDEAARSSLVVSVVASLRFLLHRH